MPTTSDLSSPPAPPVMAPPGPVAPTSRDKSYLARVARETATFKWSKATGRAGLLCLPAIAVWLVGAVLVGKHAWGMFAVAGALSASFGAFQRLGDDRLRPTLALLCGNAIMTFVGNVVGHLGWYPWLTLVTAGGLGFGGLTALGYGGWWLGLQWMIALLAFGSHAAPPGQAAEFALAVAAGGVTQVLFLRAVRRWTADWFTTQDQPPWDPVDSVAEAFLYHANPARPAGGYALRVALAIALSCLVWHAWRLPNGYWTPMTAAILLKPDFHEAATRSIARLVGTLVGAGLVTLLLAVARPGPVVLGAVLLLSIGAGLALVRVNYSLFAAFITTYVVLLISLHGLPEPAVALRRVEATLAGAAVALAVFLIPVRRTAGDGVTAPAAPVDGEANRDGFDIIPRR